MDKHVKLLGFKLDAAVAQTLTPAVNGYATSFRALFSIEWLRLRLRRHGHTRSPKGPCRILRPYMTSVSSSQGKTSAAMANHSPSCYQFLHQLCENMKPRIQEGEDIIDNFKHHDGKSETNCCTQIAAAAPSDSLASRALVIQSDSA
eukprot:2329880-Amphidinium_carterae.4